MKVLVLGGGGREHALVWKLNGSPSVEAVYCTPLNAGIDRIAREAPVQLADRAGLLRFVEDNGIDLTVVGPEQPLTEGIVDEFTAAGKVIFGPSKAAARIEGSKIFAKEFMTRHQIPTAEYRAFRRGQRFEAERYLNEMPAPVVVKADGLAAGKGVTVCETKEEARDILVKLMEAKTLGESGTSVVIEECLVGEEASVLAITDGRLYELLPTAQDHKRLLDNDMGKNTGGMGAYAPAPVVTDRILAQVKASIIEPALAGMAAEGFPFRGCLYAGLMLTPTGPKVIEFNCRFGDPETQAVLPLIEGDFAAALYGAATGDLETRLGRKEGSCVSVVVASGGYPDKYETGRPITGLDAAEADHDVVVFHAGTKKSREGIVTAGGRVVAVSAVGNDLESAVTKAYHAVEQITFDGAYYRSDIARKGLAAQRDVKQSV